MLYMYIFALFTVYMFYILYVNVHILYYIPICNSAGLKHCLVAVWDCDPERRENVMRPLQLLQLLPGMEHWRWSSALGKLSVLLNWGDRYWCSKKLSCLVCVRKNFTAVTDSCSWPLAEQHSVTDWGRSPGEARGQIVPGLGLGWRWFSFPLIGRKRL